MYHLHIRRNLRSLVFLLATAAVLTAIGTLWWANRTGLPESWRIAIEEQISQQGAYVKIGGLTYIPLRGVAASNIRVFSDPELKHEISSLEHVILDFDNTKLTRGIIHLTKVELKDAALTLPVNPNDPNSKILKCNHVNGTLFIPGRRRLEVRNATGMISGIQVTLDARLIGYQQQGEGPANDSSTGKRRMLVARIISELNKWEFDQESPPHLKIFVEGDANERSSVFARLSLTAKGVEKNQHGLEEIVAEAEIHGDLLTVTSLNAKDSRGSIVGHFDYDLSDRAGRFGFQSTLQLSPLAKAWMGFPPLPALLIAGSQTLKAEGDFGYDDNNSPNVHMTGRFQCESVLLRGISFDSAETSFSLRNRDLFLRDLRLVRSDGEATGKAMIQWPNVRLALESTLPEQNFKPLFIGKPLEKVIGDFTDREDASIFIKLEGGFDATDRSSWAYTGSGNLQNVSYRGVPVNHADCSFSLSHHELNFYDGTVVFDYRDYPMRKAFNGPAEGTTKVGQIHYKAADKTVAVKNVTGKVWAAPLVRMFAPKIADKLETYRFHEPPALDGSGLIDVTPQGRTNLVVDFDSGGNADYKFLGENLTLSKPNGKVTIRGKRVTIDDLKLDAFDGPVAAQFDFRGDGKLEGEMNWTKLSIPALSSTYGFDMKAGGMTTGRLEFSIIDGKVETMNGKGLFALEKTELFAVPIFGPLSPVISGVLGDRRAGFERAKDAFCNFQIKDGIVSTGDFQTSTTSIVFAGDGAVDLKDRTIDMTMRLNARGLLGLLTLPLRPFYGMFQFRGTGPLKATKWEHVMFTTPGEQQKELLLPAPKARAVGSGN